MKRGVKEVRVGTSNEAFGKTPKHQPLPELAYQDPQFMESLPARPLRILAEYLDPLNRLRRANIGDTIVMFGSARIQSREHAQARLKQTQAAARGRRTPPGAQKSPRLARCWKCRATTKTPASFPIASLPGL